MIEGSDRYGRKRDGVRIGVRRVAFRKGLD